MDEPVSLTPDTDPRATVATHTSTHRSLCHRIHRCHYYRWHRWAQALNILGVKTLKPQQRLEGHSALRVVVPPSPPVLQSQTTSVPPPGANISSADANICSADDNICSTGPPTLTTAVRQGPQPSVPPMPMATAGPGYWGFQELKTQQCHMHPGRGGGTTHTPTPTPTPPRSPLW